MADEMKDSRSEIRKLNDQLTELYGEFKTLSFVLKGSTEMKGIYQRLIETEKVSIECNEKTNNKIDDTTDKTNAKIDSLEMDIDQRFEAMDNKIELLLIRIESNNTTITSQLVQLHALRTNVIAFFNLFKSKYFWKLVFAVMGLIAWGKSYHSILDLIKSLLTNLKTIILFYAENI